MDIDNDLQYLAQTDEEYADKESWLTGLKETMKHHKGMWVVQSKSSVFNNPNGSNFAIRWPLCL